MVSPAGTPLDPDPAPRVLVTGSKGFIGGHTVATLKALGWPVQGLYRNLSRHGPPNAGEVVCDLADPACERALINTLRSVDAVLHSAAEVRLWGKSPRPLRANGEMTKRLVAACEQAGRPNLVLLSSASVAYRPRDQPRIRAADSLPERSMNGYASSKRESESVVRDYRGPWTILRPQAVLGPGDPHLIPPILDAARRGKWAWLGTKDKVRADLLSIANLIHCCQSALLTEGHGGTYFLSDGCPVPLEPLLREVFARAAIVTSERRIPAGVARAFAGAVEGAYGLFARHKEPPIHRFGLETITRTRIVDPGPMLDRFGPLPSTFAQGFEAALDGIVPAV